MLSAHHDQPYQGLLLNALWSSVPPTLHPDARSSCHVSDVFTQGDLVDTDHRTASINTPAYADGYQTSGIGGLLAAVLFPPLGKFGQFCLIILALSIVANNCPNIYSVSLSMQVLARWSAAIPRFVWTLLGTVCYIAIAIPGYSHFQTVLENFMLIIVSRRF